MDSEDDTEKEADAREARADRAKAAIQDPDDWTDSLGYHVVAEDGKHWEHPLVSACLLKDTVDKSLSTWLAERKEDDAPEEVARKLLEYAHDARDTAQLLSAMLEEAVEHFRKGDDTAARNVLRDASRHEYDYGDDPTVRAVATALKLGRDC